MSRGRGGLATVAALALLGVAPARATVVVDVGPERSRLEAVGEAIRAEVERASIEAPGGTALIRVESALPETARRDDLVHALLDPEPVETGAARLWVVPDVSFARPGDEPRGSAR